MQSVSLGKKPIKWFYNPHDKSEWKWLDGVVIKERGGSYRLKDGRSVQPMDIKEEVFRMEV